MPQLLVAGRSAASTNVTGEAGADTWYTTARTVTAAGSGIYLRVTSSPADLAVWWYRCGDRGVCGAPVLFPAGDHTRKLVGTNFRAGTRFCLAAAVLGGAGPHTWHGIVDWNVHPGKELVR